MQKRRKCGCPKAALIFFAAAVICLCLLSAKITLVVLAISLAAVGIWLLKR